MFPRSDSQCTESPEKLPSDYEPDSLSPLPPYDRTRNDKTTVVWMVADGRTGLAEGRMLNGRAPDALADREWESHQAFGREP